MKIFKISFLACFFAFALNAADNASDDTYVFEAKGEFAKELKSLIEKHSKDENITVNIYKSAPAAGGKTHSGKVNRNINSLKEILNTTVENQNTRDEYLNKILDNMNSSKSILENILSFKEILNLILEKQNNKDEPIKLILEKFEKLQPKFLKYTDKKNCDRVYTEIIKHLKNK